MRDHVIFGFIFYCFSTMSQNIWYQCHFMRIFLIALFLFLFSPFAMSIFSSYRIIFFHVCVRARCLLLLLLLFRFPFYDYYDNSIFSCLLAYYDFIYSQLKYLCVALLFQAYCVLLLRSIHFFSRLQQNEKRLLNAHIQ